MEYDLIGMHVSFSLYYSVFCVMYSALFLMIPLCVTQMKAGYTKL